MIAWIRRPLQAWRTRKLVRRELERLRQQGRNRPRSPQGSGFDVLKMS